MDVGVGVSSEDLRVIAVKVASEAAALLRDYACTEGIGARVRGETVRADMLSEDYIIDALRAEGVRARIVTEERPPEGDGSLSVIIDPLDGSSNYVNCIPWASVSIAFALRRAGSIGDVLAGAVAPVFHGYAFSFARGHGCFHGGHRIRDPIQAKFIAVYAESNDAVDVLGRIVSGFRGFKVRSLGSAALELAYTVYGRVSLFVDARSRLRNVDVAAALGGLHECGGFYSRLNGEPVPFSSEEVIRIGSLVASRSPEYHSRAVMLASASDAPA